MLTFIQIDPVAFYLGPIRVHWYGLMYLLGFAIAWGLANFRVKQYNLSWSSEQISDLIFYAALGVIIGGRIGYMIFYNFALLLSNPFSLIKIWQGGMSFHGGLIGVTIALTIFSWKNNKNLLEVSDFVAPLVPLGLGAGRIGNFINGELWGRPSDLPWAMIFPTADIHLRHPSQLYEFALEGIILFIFLWCYSRKSRHLGSNTAMFLIGYAICRVIVEYFREPDAHIGFIAFNWLTMGQLLSLPMIIVGLWILYKYNRT